MVVSWVAVPSLFRNHYRAGPGRGWGGHQHSCATVCHTMRIVQLKEVFVSLFFFFFGVPLKEELSLNYKQTLMFH